MHKLSIKSLGAQDRPREKAIKEGIRSLTDAELLSIFIGSGTQEENAVVLAQRMMSAVKHNLHAFAKLEIPSLLEFKGIGMAKAVTIAAAIEMGNRVTDATNDDVKMITCSDDAYAVFRTKMKHLSREEGWVIYLSQRKSIIAVEQHMTGGINGLLVDRRLIYKRAIQLNATAFVFAHNHPSGNLRPSRQDIAMTRKMQQGAITLDLQLVDHLIIADHGFYSFLDQNELD